MAIEGYSICFGLFLTLIINLCLSFYSNHNAALALRSFILYRCLHCLCVSGLQSGTLALSTIFYLQHPEEGPAHTQYLRQLTSGSTHC